MVPAKSFTNAQIPTANGEDTPWYRFCRPAAPVPPILGGSSSGSFENTTDSPSGCRGNSSPMDAFTETHVDQENLAHAPLERSLLESPSFGQPLTLVSNILQSPVIFGGESPCYLWMQLKGHPCFSLNLMQHFGTKSFNVCWLYTPRRISYLISC